MLEEILKTISISPLIDKIIIVTKDKKALEISKKFDTVQIVDDKESGVNDVLLLSIFLATLPLPQYWLLINEIGRQFMQNLC